MVTQADRRAATRRRILDAARTLFVRDGIGATTTGAIIEAAGISRGALYHHFASRDDVVAAVFDEESAGAVMRAVANVDAADPAARLTQACVAWLREVADPGVGRIVVVEGPAALGAGAAREIESRHSLSIVADAVQEVLTRAGRPAEPVEVDLRARLINATLAEAAFVVATAPRSRATRTRRAVEANVEAVIAALLAVER